jgi:hypothetical protein
MLFFMISFLYLSFSPRRRFVDNIKMDLREIGWGCMDWLDPSQDKEQWRALVNMVMNFWVL